MKLQIAPGCSVNLSDAEQSLLERLRHSILKQDMLSSDEIAYIIRLVDKNVVKRRNTAGSVTYEIRSGIDW